MNSPSQISREVVAGLRRYFSGTQMFELPLDVMRNARNKIAVTPAADAPSVAEGTERYGVDEAGQTVFAKWSICDHGGRAGRVGAVAQSVRAVDS